MVVIPLELRFAVTHGCDSKGDSGSAVRLAFHRRGVVGEESVCAEWTDMRLSKKRKALAHRAASNMRKYSMRWQSCQAILIGTIVRTSGAGPCRLYRCRLSMPARSGIDAPGTNLAEGRASCQRCRTWRGAGTGCQSSQRNRIDWVWRVPGCGQPSGEG
jgi:hypothetical protein